LKVFFKVWNPIFNKSVRSLYDCLRMNPALRGYFSLSLLNLVVSSVFWKSLSKGLYLGMYSNLYVLFPLKYNRNVDMKKVLTHISLPLLCQSCVRSVESVDRTCAHHNSHSGRKQQEGVENYLWLEFWSRYLGPTTFLVYIISQKKYV